MPDQITLKALELLRSADPSPDEINSLDKFIAHQGEVIKMYEQYASYVDHPQADKMKARLKVFDESALAFTWLHTQALVYKREKLLAQASELEMANALLEVQEELNILKKLNE